MKATNYILIAFTSLSIASCGPKKADEVIKKDNACFYTYNHSSSVLEWTAFKFTEKTGVNGTFKEIIIESPETSSDNPEKLLTQLSFKIPTSTVETQNEERNGKISGIFFKSMSTDTIRGSVKKLDFKKGTALIDIQMNNVNKDVKGTCRFVDGTFTFKATINLNDWNGAESINSLNRVCKDLHTGSDGKSVLWSEIDLSFTTLLLSDCD